MLKFLPCSFYCPVAGKGNRVETLPDGRSMRPAKNEVNNFFALVQLNFKPYASAILYEGFQMTIARDCAALVDATLNMVKTAPRHVKFKDMANAAGVNPTWVTRFAKGDIKKPDIAVVERLNAYLKGV